MIKFMSYKNYIQACIRGCDMGLLEVSLEFPISKESEEEFLFSVCTRFFSLIREVERVLIDLIRPEVWSKQ